MRNSCFENYLNKEVIVFEKDFGNNFLKEKLFENNFCYQKIKNINLKFLEINYSSITVSLDNHNKISSIRLYLDDIISKNFYSSFINKYGLPSSILKEDNRSFLSEGMSEDKDFKQYLRKSVMKLKESIFEEDPLYLTWNNNKYKIEIFINREDKKARVIFSAQ